MTQAKILEALLAIRGAQLEPSRFNASRSAVVLSGGEIAHEEDAFVDVRLSRARLLSGGVEPAALLNCRKDWTLLNPAELSSQSIEGIVKMLSGGGQQPSYRKRTKR